MLQPGLRNALLAATLLLGACQPKQQAAAPEGQAGGKAVVLNHVTVIDGTGAEPKADQAVVIGADGKIASVGPAAQVQAPSGAETVDMTGKFVTPGLIDLHVHIGNVVDMNNNWNNYSRQSVEHDLKTLASYGVTTAASMGTDSPLIYDVIKEQRSGRPTMARIYTAGYGIVFKGGYGGVVPGAAEPNPLVSTPEEATAAVDAQAANNPDYIKFWVDDEQHTMPKMPRNISKAIIDAAHKHGKKAFAHIFYLEDAKALVEQGVDGFVHQVRDQPVDQALIDAMKAKGVVQFAETLSREASMVEFSHPSAVFDDPFFQRGVSPAQLAALRSPERQKTQQALPYYSKLQSFVDTAMANTAKEIKDGGVTIGFGTDSGPLGRYLGFFAHWELELLTKDGMTPLQAITTATGKAAQILGNNDIGVVAPGKWADLMVLDANPAADIRNSRQIRAVYIAGNKVWEPGAAQ